jgi:UDP-GlcNAc3NAcA epimerase
MLWSHAAAPLALLASARMGKVRVVAVAGTRPELIKGAAMLSALRADHDLVTVMTGQHYDHGLAAIFVNELHSSPPDRVLDLDLRDPRCSVGVIASALTSVIADVRPGAVMVDGDTDSALAGALAGIRAGSRVAHVEAGLRSFDPAMPEERNRIVIDHLAHWLFSPTPAAVENLAAEGIRQNVIRIGDPLMDIAARTIDAVRDPAVLREIGRRIGHGPAPWASPGGYLLCTVHRAENRLPTAMAAWADILGALAEEDRPVVLVLHPGTGAAMEGAGIQLPASVIVAEPLGYRTMLALQLHAALVLTDSGGMQRESGWLGTPCLVLRNSTEWVELVAESEGRMVLVGLDRALAIESCGRIAPRHAAVEMAVGRAARVQLSDTRAGEQISRRLTRDGSGPIAA